MLNIEQLKDRRKLLEVCFLKKIGHLSSALSFIDIWHDFNKQIKNNALVIGNANTPVIFNNFYNRSVEEICADRNLYPNMLTTKCNYTSISLGNALGIATGIALSNTYQTTYITIGDSILHAGTELEAAMYIGNNYRNMSKIILIVNSNNCGCISQFENFDQQLENTFKAFNWNVLSINGHDYESIKSSAVIANNSDKPICILCKTIKGSGISFIENNAINWHYHTLNEELYLKAMDCLR